MLDGIDDAYRGVLEPVLTKHRKTLHKIDKCIADGHIGQARRLWRTSGILHDLAAALASAGVKAAGTIREGIKQTREVMQGE